MKIRLIVILLSLSTSAAYADCPIVLNTTESSENNAFNLAYLKSIDEFTWNTLRKTHNIDSDFFGWGMDINGDSDYTKFSEERRRVLSRVNIDLSSSRSKNYVTQNFSANARDAYIACIAQKSDSRDFYAIPISVTDTNAIVRFVISPPSGLEATLLVEGLSGTKKSQSDVQETLSSLKVKGSREITFDRDRDVDLLIAVNSIEGFQGSASVLIVAEPVVVRQPEPDPQSVTIEAASYLRAESSNVAIASEQVAVYGNGTVLLNAPPYGPANNSATWEFSSNAGGRYDMFVTYAALLPRPVTISINGAVVNPLGLNEVTGGWMLNNSIRLHQGNFELLRGKNKVRFSRAGVFPHIRRIEFIPD